MLELGRIGQNEWISLLEQGGVLVTVNQRLARSLHDQFEEYQSVTKGRSFWETPTILPLSAWLLSLWEHQLNDDELFLSSNKTVLNSFQSQQIWRQIIQDSHGGIYQQNADELSALALKAWKIINEWCVTDAHLAGSNNPNVVAFRQWKKNYQQRCLSAEWIDEASLIVHVLALLQTEQKTALPAQCVFAGFDEFTPALEKIMQVLMQRSCQLSVMAPVVCASSVTKQIYHNTDQEIAAVATAVAEALEAAPDMRIGVVVPELSKYRERIVRQFEDVLHINACMNYGLATPMFNVSLGYALADYPLIRSIFIAFNLFKSPIHVDECTAYLLNTYFFADIADVSLNALVDRELRARDELWLDLDVLMQIARSLGCNGLLQRLHAVSAFCEHSRQSLLPSQWCTHIVRFLQTQAWLAGLELHSSEYQLYNAWQKILDEYSQQDQIMGVLTWSEAVSLLKKMTAAQVFQPEAQRVPIHILGLFETAGLAFDALWVIGLNDEAFPVAASPNPFLPIEIQRKLGLPHSSCDREYQYAQQLLTRLSTSADSVVLSCALHENDKELRPSPLLVDGGAALFRDEVTLPETLALRLFQSTTLETWRDESASLPGALVEIKGGAAVIKHQAACPFRAFAYYRLYASDIHQPAMGLSHLDRGVLMHGVLENFWRKLTTQQAMLALSEQQLTQELRRLAKQQLAILAKSKPHTFTSRFMAMECQRLVTRIKEWLALERDRAVFEVAAVESQHRVELGGLALTIKMDRVDRLADGSLFLIDYKTGQPSVMDWFSERPLDPQLPLYAVSLADDVRSIAFAQLKVGLMTYKGLTDTEGCPSGVERFKGSKYAFGEATWTDLLNEWSQRITALAIAFKHGDATVTPKDASVCQQCELAAMCRISSLGYMDEEAGRE